MIGPGDLYSSIAPCFLAVDAPAVFKKAKGKKILVSNTVARLGETHGFRLRNSRLRWKNTWVLQLDYVLYNNKPFDKVVLANYRKDHPEIGEELVVGKDLPKNKFIGADILKKGEFAYDSKKVIKEIFKLVNCIISVSLLRVKKHGIQGNPLVARGAFPTEHLNYR